jgi:cobalt-zinc-cadmium efflux system outer membrane protein
MLFSKIGLVLACALTLPQIHAQTSLIVTLPSIRGRIHAQNPDLAAAKIRIQEARARHQQTGRLKNPEIENSFEHNLRFNEGAIEIGLSQRFPLTDRLRLEGQVSQVKIQVAEMEVKDVERRLVSEACHYLIEALAIRQQSQLLIQQNKLTTELATSIRRAGQQGESSLLDASQADIEALQVTTKIRQLRMAELATIGKLKPLLGMHAGKSLIVSGSLPEARLPELSSAHEKRPDYKAAQLKNHAATRNVALEQARRLDDAEATLFSRIERTEDAPVGLKNEGIIGVRFKIALPFWDKNEGKIEEAQAIQTRKRLETTALARGIALEAEGALTEMREWAKLITEISTRLLPLAAEQSKKTEAAYQAAQTNLQTVLRSREQRLQLTISRVDALREFHLARIRYQTATGTL